ncbi:MAG: hypothetical protein AB7S44_03135 [Spirochaetales bacterium]
MNSQENIKLNHDLKILASLNHKQFNHWLDNQNKHSIRLENGDLIIPAEKSERWTRQMKTAYRDLSEEEKDSDRNIARGWLKDIEHITFESEQVKTMISTLKEPNMLETIAALEHDDWSTWTSYIFASGTKQEDDSLLLEKSFVDKLDHALNEKNFDNLKHGFKTLFTEPAINWVAEITMPDEKTA